MNCLSVNQVSSLKWDFFRDVLQYSKRGFNGIGIWRSKLDDLGISEAATLLQEMHLEVSSLSWIGGFTGAEGISFRQAIDDALEGIDCAAELKANCLILHPGAQGMHTSRHARRLLGEALEILVPVAEALGVRLAVEPMLGLEQRRWTMLAGLQETLAAIEAYAPNQVGIVLDFFHLGSDSRLACRLPSFVDRIHLVQISNRRMTSHPLSDRCLPRGGDLGLTSWIRLLSLAGYQGPIEAEIFGPEVQHLGYDCVLDAAWEFLADCREIHRSVNRRAQPTTRKTSPRN